MQGIPGEVILQNTLIEIETDTTLSSSPYHVISASNTYVLLVPSGAFHILEYPRVLVDIAAVWELQRVVLDQNLVLGGGASLTRALAAFHRLAAQRPEFAYLQKLYDHILLVAHIPVRNVR